MLTPAFSPIDLPCGRRIHNRLVKVALYEHLAALLGGPPNEYHYSLYSKWSRYDWGMIITGNVQISPTHLSLGRDVVMPREITHETLEPFKKWCHAIHGDTSKDVLAIIQLSHAGRQSPNIIGGRRLFEPPSAPSTISVGSPKSGWLGEALHFFTFQSPRELSIPEIDEVVEGFVRGAQVASMSGFDGIELHAAHGYLLAQFISPKSNVRVDEYSSNGVNALRLLHRIASTIRAVLSPDFILGIKMNAADYATSQSNHTTDEQRVLDHVRTIAGWGLIDFIEVSGGDYESPFFMGTTSSPRQALFSRFSQAAVQTLESIPPSSCYAPPLVLLTGGLRTPALVHSALSSNHAHLLGFGRPSVLCPDLPALLREIDSPEECYTPFRPDPDLSVPTWVRKLLPSNPLIAGGFGVAWYNVTMRRLAGSAGQKSLKPDYGLGPLGAFFWMWVWIDTWRLHVLPTGLLGFVLAGVVWILYRKAIVNM